MIILLQSVAIQFGWFFLHILYYKVRQSNFITKHDRLLLQSASCITKCDRLLLQSASGITKCDSYYKVRRNKRYKFIHFCFKISFSNFITNIFWGFYQTSAQDLLTFYGDIYMDICVHKLCVPYF